MTFSALLAAYLIGVFLKKHYDSSSSVFKSDDLCVADHSLKVRRRKYANFPNF